ncbi:hypothetical protein LR69_00516 [Geobacillus sp. BCO2]|nr:hypothetical protein LR69_00516 [Geobacillus sp. BCO2]
MDFSYSPKVQELIKKLSAFHGGVHLSEREGV